MMMGIDDREFLDSSNVFRTLLSPTSDGGMGPGLEAVEHLGGKAKGVFDNLKKARK